MRRNSQFGFTLIELMVALALGTLVIGSAVMLFTTAMQDNYRVIQRSGMQQSARAAMNAIGHDLSLAGTGIPQGGVQLPTAGAGPRYACDAVVCYALTNAFPNQRLYSLIPNPNGGPVTTEQTDTVTVTYVDPLLPLTGCPLAAINAAGTSATLGACTIVPPAGTPAYNDPGVGLRVGDVLMFSNSNGAALGVLTAVTAATGVMTFAVGDALNLNRSAAATGTVANLATAGVYPATTVTRLLIVTYYINILPGPDGVKPASGLDADDIPVLMRQVNAQTPIPLADYIEDVQLFYNLYDDGTGALNTGVTNVNYAGGQSPNIIRDVLLQVTSRTQRAQSMTGGGVQRLILASTISPRNLSFKNRYN